MVRFIFLCMAVTVLSFGIVPVYMGIADERGALVANIEPSVGDATGTLDTLEKGTSLTFEEIYALTDVYSDDAMAQDDIAFILNDIEPAAEDAGAETVIAEDSFSTGFDKQGHPAL